MASAAAVAPTAVVPNWRRVRLVIVSYPTIDFDHRQYYTALAEARRIDLAKALEQETTKSTDPETIACTKRDTHFDLMNRPIIP